MLLLEGIPISPGYASGIAVVYDCEVERRFELPRRSISRLEVATEGKRLNDALELSSRDLMLAGENAAVSPGLADSVAVLLVHLEMAKEIAALVNQHIGREFVNVEQALDSVIRDFVERLQQLDNSYLRQREQDVRDVGRRMMRHLAGSSPWTNQPLPPGSVIVARELLPSEAVELAKSGLVAIVCEHGGAISHTAIIARSLGIPAITGITNATSQIDPGARLLVNGESGSLVVAPSKSDWKSFAKRQREYKRLTSSIAIKEKLPCVTQDHVQISLVANIGLPEEVESVARHNLTGVGLFRTEFLFLESHERPSSQAQFAIYQRVMLGLGGIPLAIRTFDLGGDKLPPFLMLEGKENHTPRYLRGLRFSLAERSLLDAQLHAIVRLAQSSDVRILFPMVIGGDDLARAIAAVDRVSSQLGLSRRPAVGAMIETPAALYSLDEILDLADFVALGTNDLTQYLLAADRDLTELSDTCTAMHPTVLRAIKQVVGAAEKWQCPVCVCGEEAGDVDFARLLIGLGIRELSLTPTRAAAVRQALRDIRCDYAQKLADSALVCQTPQQVRRLFQSPKRQGIRPSNGESSAATSGEFHTVETAIRLPFLDAEQRPSLCEVNEALEHRVAEVTKHLTVANLSLMAAAEDARLAAVSFDGHDSIVITDKSGKILRVNPSFTKLTGYAPADVIGKTPRILRSGQHDKGYYREMWRAIGTDGFWEGEIWNKRKDGQIYLQRLTIACVKNESGETTHYVGNGQDITQQKQGDVDRAAIRAARAVQRTLFPLKSPAMPGVDIAGAAHPAERVSGDFFDYLALGKNSTGIVVADVSGHGLGPAILMSQTQAYLRALAESHTDPGELLTRANRLFSANDSGHLVTIFLGRLDSGTHSFDYACAGHEGYLFSSNGSVQVLKSTSVPLGVEANTVSVSAPAKVLHPGDTLLIPTDGIEESMSPQGRMFGRERMLDVVHENRTKSAAQIVDALFCATRRFSGGRPQKDDVTAVVVKVLSQKGVSSRCDR